VSKINEEGKMKNEETKTGVTGMSNGVFILHSSFCLFPP
jgi:hypothetical protein